MTTAVINELSMADMNEKLYDYVKIDENAEDAANYIYELLLDDAIMGTLFEFHHGLKTGLTDIIEGEREDDESVRILNTPHCDIFGFSITKKTLDANCTCPNCERPVSAARFAPHLEKCMGMGRNSSRIASRRIASNTREPSYVGLLSDDDDDADWSGASTSSDRRKKKVKNVGAKKSNKGASKTSRSVTMDDQKRRAVTVVESASTSDIMVPATADDAGSPLDSSPSSSCSSSSRKRDRLKANKHKKERRNLSPPPPKD